MIYLILILGFLTVLFIFLGLYSLLLNKKLKVADRMDLYLGDEEESGDQEDISFKEFVLRTIGSIGRAASRKSFMEEKKIKLQQAYIFMRVEEFLGLSLLVAAGLGLLLFLLTRMWFIGLAGFLLGFRLPDVVVTSTKKKRMKQLNSQLPESLTILSNGQGQALALYRQ